MSVNDNNYTVMDVERLLKAGKLVAAALRAAQSAGI